MQTEGYLAQLGRMASLTPAKQSRRSVRSLSVQEKVLAIDRVHDGESKASVARDIGVPESTLRGWCKGEEKLRGIVARSTGNNSENAGSSNDESFDRPMTGEYQSADTTTTSTTSHKREYTSTEDNLYRSKYAKLDKAYTLPDTSQRDVESPLNFSKNSDSSKSPTDLSKRGNSPALAAISSAMTNKGQQNMYNGILPELLSKPETASKPLDFSTKLTPRLPRPDVSDALMCWLQAQREHTVLPMSPMEGKTADSSSWFWKWYKNCGGLLPQVPTTPQTSRTVNGATDNGQVSDEEDDPPATAADALRHGEKFLRWLECCSDPSVTALQILQFRYLLKNVKDCAERKARQVRTKTRSRRK